MDSSSRGLVLSRATFSGRFDKSKAGTYFTYCVVWLTRMPSSKVSRQVVHNVSIPLQLQRSTRGKVRALHTKSKYQMHIENLIALLITALVYAARFAFCINAYLWQKLSRFSTRLLNAARNLLPLPQAIV